MKNVCVPGLVIVYMQTQIWMNAFVRVSVWRWAMGKLRRMRNWALNIALGLMCVYHDTHLAIINPVQAEPIKPSLMDSDINIKEVLRVTTS